MELNRQRALERQKKETFDLLVVGGGATGAGIALDAATRGLSVALVERGDFSCSTSSRSTKLVHGGVRYLEQAILKFDRSQFNLVREALHERSTLFQLAPHLVHLLPIFTPIYRSIDVPYYLTGLKLYDRLSGRHNLKPSHYVRAKAALNRIPLLKAKGLKGGVVYYDGQFDDARMNVALVLTAAAEGAALANYVEVKSLIKNEGRVGGAVVADVLTGESWNLRAKVVVNATGPFVDSLRRMEESKAKPILSQSSGVHIILDASFTPPDLGLLIPKTEDGRVLFVLPWLGRSLVGTTDNPANLEPHPKASAADVRYILKQLGNYYRKVPPARGIHARWSGLRPLVSNPESHTTAALSRDHVIQVGPGGLVSIAGGKWTTYRRMAVDAVDVAVKQGGWKSVAGSKTQTRLLAGAEGFRPTLRASLVKEFGLAPAVAAHLVRAYGDQAPRVARLSRDEGLQAPLSPAFPYLEAEVLHGVRVEGACRAVDVLARRTRLSFLDQKEALAALPRVVELMGGELGWDKERRQAEYRIAKEYLG